VYGKRFTDNKAVLSRENRAMTLQIYIYVTNFAISQ